MVCPPEPSATPPCPQHPHSSLSVLVLHHAGWHSADRDWVSVGHSSTYQSAQPALPLPLQCWRELAWVHGKLSFHWMAFPGAGHGFDPKMGPLLPSLEGKHLLNTVPSTSPAAIRQKYHILPTPSLCQIGYFLVDSNYLPFLVWFLPGFSPAEPHFISIRVMRTNGKDCPEVRSFSSPRILPPEALQWTQTWSHLPKSIPLEI